MRPRRTGLSLRPLSSDATGQLNVLGHDGDPLGVDGAQIGIFEQTHEISLARFLEGHDSRALEAQLGLEILSNLTNKSLEGKFADEKFGALLVAANLSKCDCAGPIAMRFLHSSGGGGTLASSLRSQLLARSLASSRLASRLLGASHVFFR